ncbi:hypothetical protein D0867_13226 [Hortaea werneckii]|uniref:Quinate dehydrogenase n=1 Tax=Hortaea werneckii TaxID=91943 RepID=A0A3M6XZT9_HORWE|nr:hypothetical protein D0867_13226 [Hortaea werneckii]
MELHNQVPSPPFKPPTPPDLFQPPTNNAVPIRTGSAVTMPHKVAILPYLDSITPEGRAVGACNTVFRRDGLFIGTNTDTIGVRESFLQNVASPAKSFENRPGMVIGGGGAARSAVYALVKFLGCEKVYLVNRDAGEVKGVMEWCQAQGYGDGLVHVATKEEAEGLEGPGAIVACVPNFPPVTAEEREARAVVEVMLGKSHKGAILEMCYHPTPWTEIAALAEKAGWQVILGTEAVIYQGLEQDKYWTGKELDELPVAEVKEVIANELLKSKL